MNPTGLDDLYLARALEYLVVIAYLALFVPFWRYATGTAVGAAEVDWFRVPDGFELHPGHAWVRTAPSGLATVGVDDFARAVMGPITEVTVPEVGARLRTGAPAWTLHGPAGTLRMVAPVDGEIVEVNPDAARSPSRIEGDPYGAGWLLRVRRAPGGDRLPSGRAARHWMRTVAERLHRSFAPELGPVAADGGTPVHGIALGLPPEARERFLREFFEIPGTRT